MTLWVVKLGTSLLRGDTAATIDGFAAGIAAAFARGDRVVLVSSGAVGLGCQRLQLPQRPETVVALQAAAATGQGQLMALYERALANHGIAGPDPRHPLGSGRPSPLSERLWNPATAVAVGGVAGGQ